MAVRPESCRSGGEDFPRRRAVPSPADARVSTPRQSPLQLPARAAGGLAHVRRLRRSPGARQAVLRLLRPSMATRLGRAVAVSRAGYDH